jgi:hypothetical protein
MTDLPVENIGLFLTVLCEKLAPKEKAGLKAATMFWPGSETEIRGVRPSWWLPWKRGQSTARCGAGLRTLGRL